MAEGASGFGGRGSSSGWGGGAASPGAADDLEPGARDVITDESILDDWEFEIWVDVVLEDYPESETEDEENVDAEDGGE